LLVGEIGIPRREFLYDIRFWEARRIIRGYRNRDKLKLQIMAECAFASMFAMRDPKGKTVQDMFPILFDDDDEEESTASISDEDREDLTALIRNLNERTPQPQTNKKE
jgi:hypothetical protein